MSTNHTPHFNLSQWEPDDQVVRTEFNENHAKIEHAFFNHPSAELIAGGEIEEETSSLAFDVSGLDWSRYMALALVIDTPLMNGFSVYMNSEREHSITIYTSEFNSISHIGEMALCSIGDLAHITAIIPVFYDGRNAASLFTLGYGGRENYNKGFGIAALGAGGGCKPLNQCPAIRVTRRSGSFLPGDRAVLWGIK